MAHLSQCFPKEMLLIRLIAHIIQKTVTLLLLFLINY